MKLNNPISQIKENQLIQNIVDAQKDLGRYRGIYSMTPNLPDTQKHVGFYLNSKEDFLKAGNKIIQEAEISAQ